MKKNLLYILFALLILNPANSTEIKESTIHTHTTINREVEPDAVKIRFYVENSGLNLTEVKQKNDKMVNSALNAIKALLKDNETIKTTTFNVRDIYSYKDKVRVFQKYEVTNGFEVKLKELDKISKVIDTALANGVKRADRLNFYVENSENICNEMMADALKMAKNRVKYIANSAGFELDKVKNINPYCSLSSGHVQSKAYKMMSNGISSDASTESIEIGTIKANSSVDLTYYIK